MGQILSKPGMGGFGMQAYDGDDGKYVEVTLKVGDKTVSTFDEYLDVMREKHPEDASGIDNRDPEIMEKYSQKFSTAFQKKVEIMNRGRYSVFKDVEDMEKNFDKLFHPRFLETLKKLCPDGNSTEVKITPIKNLYMDSATLAIFNGRFGRSKMKPMSEEEFKELYESDTVDKTLTTKAYQNYGAWKADSTAEFLRNLGKGKAVAFFRGVHNAKGNDTKETIARGFWDENSPVLSNISCNKNGAGYGIYTMPSIDVLYAKLDYGYGKGYIAGQKGIVILHGLVENVSDLKIAVSQWGKTTREVRDLQIRAGNKEFGLKMADALFAKGFGDIHQCHAMAKNISRAINNDFGTAAAMLGYDMMTGYGHEMVILNPGCARVSTTYNTD